MCSGGGSRLKQCFLSFFFFFFLTRVEEWRLLEALAWIFRKTQMYIGINPVCCTTSTFLPRWSILQSVRSFHCCTFNGNQWSLRSTNRRALFIFLLHLVAVIVVLVFFFVFFLGSAVFPIDHPASHLTNLRHAPCNKEGVIRLRQK